MANLKRWKNKKLHIQVFALVACLLVLAVFWWRGADERASRRLQADELARVEKIKAARKELSQQLGPWFQQNNYPTEAEIRFMGKNEKFSFEYTFDRTLQKQADDLLKAYKPDYGAIVVIDSLTGRVMALSSFQKGAPAPVNLNLKSTFPAASVFKIVTASAAVDRYKLSPDTLIMFNGANHTLYKKNVMYTNVNRWTREITLREAFARSINTVFGRLTFEKMQPKDIEDYAIRFGFNTQIQSDLPFDLSFTQIPDEKSFHLAEIASGYNRVTTMSPIHGALIASSVAAGGAMRVPYVIQKVRNQKGQVVFDSEPVTAAVTLSGEGAERLRDLMEATITEGTSRKSFRPLLKDRKFSELELGGKTGSLMGTQPKGKVDWFVGYGIGGDSDRLSVAAITVNVNYWTVKSSHLAQMMMRTHFKDQFSERNQKFFNASRAEH